MSIVLHSIYPTNAEDTQFERTGDQKWLDRARKFAMHAIDQRNGRYTLFTGELGLAMYLMACVKKDSRFPILDYI
jgi:hypothetical protein